MFSEPQLLHELIQALMQHPEGRERLRALLFPESARLEAALTELAEAQRRTEARLERLEQAVERLVSWQQKTEARLERLEQAVERLVSWQQKTEARLERLEQAVERLVSWQQKTEARLERLEQAVERLVIWQQKTESRLARLEEEMTRLAEAQRKTEEHLRALTRRVDRIEIRLDKVYGWFLEERFRRRVFAYLGTHGFRRPRALEPAEMIDQIEQGFDAGRLTEEERNTLFQVDAVVEAVHQGQRIFFIAEVSSVVDVYDVERAYQRAQLWSRLAPDVEVHALVVGESMPEKARHRAEQLGVWSLLDGQLLRSVSK